MVYYTYTHPLQKLYKIFVNAFVLIKSNSNFYNFGQTLCYSASTEPSDHLLLTLFAGCGPALGNYIFLQESPNHPLAQKQASSALFPMEPPVRTSFVARAFTGLNDVEVPSTLSVKRIYATPYGKAIYKGTKNEEVHEFEPLQWYNTDEKPSKFFLHKRDIRLENSTKWDSEMIERNQRRDFTPKRKGAERCNSNCVCF